MVEDYAYVGTNFSGDPDIPLPPGGQWGDIGKKKNPKMEIVFLCFNVLYIFLCVVTRLKRFHVDVGAARLGGSSPLDRRVGAHFVP